MKNHTQEKTREPMCHPVEALQHEPILTVTPLARTNFSSPHACACDGGCPRCSVQTMPTSANQEYDFYEQEADALAEQLSVSPHSPQPAVQLESPPEHSLLQLSPNLGDGDNLIKGSGEHLPASLQQTIARRLGHNFSPVRVHQDDRAAELARSMNARALTLGNRIAFNSGEYQPHTQEGRRLIAHELVHVVQQSQAHTTPAVIQLKKSNLYVFDSTQKGVLGTAWQKGVRLWAMAEPGGYAVPSGPTIETMLKRMLKVHEASGCECIEEIQFWCHGASGVSMNISKSERLTTADFNIPGLKAYRERKSFFWYMRQFQGNMQNAVFAWQAQETAFDAWKAGLPEKSRLLIALQEAICSSGAEVYYRSCETFQGEKGQDFAKAAANFWDTKVIGHTHVIGLSQPGKETLKPGEEPDWDKNQGVGKESKHIMKTILKTVIGKGILKTGKSLLQ